MTVTGTRLYGKATARAWDRLHPRLTRRAAWLDHDGPLPIIEGTVVRLLVEKLPSGGGNKPVWLWWSEASATPDDVDRCWQSFLPFRSEAHVSPVQTDTRLDETPASQLRNGRPVDVAGDRRLRPAPARPPSRARPPTAVGAAGGTEQAHSGPSEAGVQEPAGEDGHASRCTETHPTRPRSTAWLEESTTRHPLRRRASPRHERVLHPTRAPPARN